MTDSARRIITLILLTIGFSTSGNVLYRLSVNPMHAQGYSDGKDCTLTSNPPIAGRMVDGLGCVPVYNMGTTISQLLGGPFTRSSEGGIVTTVPLKCPAGTEKVLVPGGDVKCASGLVDPE